MSVCRLTHQHCGPGVEWRTAVASDKENLNLPPCHTQLTSTTVTTAETSTPVDESYLLAYAGPQSPQDYAGGFLNPYTSQKWEAWLKQFSLQTAADYKVCTGKNLNKESDTGVVMIGGKAQTYRVKWRQCYSCFRGGSPRFKKPDPKAKSRNAPGSRLMDCKATLNVHLLRLDSGTELLHITFPLSTAHTNHSPTSMADLHSHKPLPEVMEKVESLICNSHLSQMSLMLALRDWIKHQLIPRHLQEGILATPPSDYNRRYFPSVKDVQNMSRRVINRIRNNMFDQDALEQFLQRETERNNGFNFHLRKYEASDGGSEQRW